MSGFVGTPGLWTGQMPVAKCGHSYGGEADASADGSTQTEFERELDRRVEPPPIDANSLMSLAPSVSDPRALETGDQWGGVPDTGGQDTTGDLPLPQDVVVDAQHPVPSLNRSESEPPSEPLIVPPPASATGEEPQNGPTALLTARTSLGTVLEHPAKTAGPSHATLEHPVPHPADPAGAIAQGGARFGGLDAPPRSTAMEPAMGFRSSIPRESVPSTRGASPLGSGPAVLDADVSQSHLEENGLWEAVQGSGKALMSAPSDGFPSRPIAHLPGASLLSASQKAAGQEGGTQIAQISVSSGQDVVKTVLPTPTPTTTDGAIALSSPKGMSLVSLKSVTVQDGPGSSASDVDPAEPSFDFALASPEGLRHGPSVDGVGPRAVRVPMDVLGQIAQVVVSAGEGPQPEFVELNLSPLELGKMRIEFRTGSDGLYIHLGIERQETLDLVRRHLDDLSADLRSSGFGQTTFSFGTWSQRGSSDRSARGPTLQGQDVYRSEETMIVGRFVDAGRLHLRL